MQEEKELSYFQKRLNELGVTPELNKVTLVNPEAEFPQKKHAECEIFSEDDKGNIRILVYGIRGEMITYEKKGDGKMSQLNAKWLPYYITRLKEPKVKPNGDIQKYSPPYGTKGAFPPFFPPHLLTKFKEKETIETLVLTEGYFKAFKGGMHGIDVVGLGSITHYRDSETKALHPDIVALIKACNVKKVVWLLDGDCNTLSGKAIAEGTDIYKKPNNFFSSAKAIKQLLDDYNVEKYFAHIKSESVEGSPKGLDDLLLALGNEAHKVKEDLLTFSKPCQYFEKINITFSAADVHRYLKLHSVNDFFLFHVHKIPALKDKEFVFNGTKYKWDEEKQECKVKIPAEAKNYFRVGDQYHEKIQIPNKYNQLDKTFHRRAKGTIVDDYGKTFVNHIPKYKAFCNVPDHTNYQEVIHSCYNIYAPFEHEAAEGDCETTIEFLKHIFGSGKIKWKHPDTNEEKEISELELGLDYIQILYQKPTQILPILCLVSKENNTGKSTFAKWLRMVFTQNVAVVGNAELENDFNASWASKLLVICDEAKIDKHKVVEKVKAFSTADKIFMNAKGKDHIEIDFFGKFLFMTNNEENFIYASDEDVRYWVRKVPTITKLNVNLLADIQEEIPAFLNMLNKRKMHTECMHRAWFDPRLIKTDALKKVIQYSMPTIEKEMRVHLRDMFLDFGVDEILMTKTDLHKAVFNNKYESNYVENVIKDRLKAEPFYKMEGDEKKYIVTRYSYPRWEKRINGNSEEMVRVEVKGQGRPYVFKVADFLTPDEIQNRSTDAEMKYANDLYKMPNAVGDRETKQRG